MSIVKGIKGRDVTIWLQHLPSDEPLSGAGLHMRSLRIRYTSSKITFADLILNITSIKPIVENHFYEEFFEPILGEKKLRAYVSKVAVTNFDGLIAFDSIWRITTRDNPDSDTDCWRVS